VLVGKKNSKEVVKIAKTHDKVKKDKQANETTKKDKNVNVTENKDKEDKQVALPKEDIYGRVIDGKGKYVPPGKRQKLAGGSGAVHRGKNDGVEKRKKELKCIVNK